MKHLIFDLLENQYAKLVLWAAALGTVFGIGFLAGKIGTRVQSDMAYQANDLKDLSRKEQEFKKIQKELKLTYYTELLNQPKKIPTEILQSQTVANQPVVKTAVEANAEDIALSQELDAAPKPSALRTEKPESNQMAKALARVLGSQTPVSVKEAIKETLPSSTGSAFAIQIASFPDKRAAEEMAERLSAKGLPARLVEADVTGKGVVYRVRLHGFKTREEAESFKQKKQLDGITVAQ